MHLFYFVTEIDLLFHPVSYISGAPQSRVANGFHVGQCRSRPRKVLETSIKYQTLVFMNQKIQLQVVVYYKNVKH